MGKDEFPVLLSEEAKIELQWWKDNILSHSLIDISHGKPDFVLFSDASFTGWGCSSEHGRTGGHWNSTEVAVSINALELKARSVSYTHLTLPTTAEV